MTNVADKDNKEVQVVETKSALERKPSIYEDIEALFDEPFRFFPSRWAGFRFPEFRMSPGTQAWAPKVDVAEADGKLTVKADLPGVKQEDIQVTLEDDTVVIRAKRETRTETQEPSYHRIERESGEYFRAIPVPDGTKSEAVKAAYKDGVLDVTIELPKASKTKATIKVQ